MEGETKLDLLATYDERATDEGQEVTVPPQMNGEESTGEWYLSTGCLTKNPE